MSHVGKCAMCRGPLSEESDEEKMRAELHENFPGFEPEDCDVICDDCYQKHIATFREMHERESGR